MKCIYCGNELDEGDLFCPRCKKAAQIVPDYNVYEDDYLKQVLKEENRPKKKRETKHVAVQEPDADRRKQQKKKQMKIIGAVAGTAFVLVLALLVLAAAVRSNHANSVSYQLTQAEKAYAKGNRKEALAYYERALELDPGNNEIRLKLAELYMELEQEKDAEKLCKLVIRDDKANRRACKILIGIYDGDDDLDEILSLYDRVDESLYQLFDNYMVVPPEFGLDSGTYETAQTLVLRAVKDYQIYYTLDGTDPVTGGMRYDRPLVLDENGKTYRVRAVCRNERNIYSEAKERSYTIKIPSPDMPIVTPDGGDFGVKTSVSITVPDGCSAYYTWDGSTPNRYSNHYTHPITVPEGNNILTVIIIDNTTNLSSDLYRGRFVYYESNPEEDEQQDAE